MRAQQLGPFTARNSSTAATARSESDDSEVGSSLDVFSPGFAFDDVLALALSMKRLEMLQTA